MNAGGHGGGGHGGGHGGHGGGHHGGGPGGQAGGHHGGHHGHEDGGERPDAPLPPETGHSSPPAEPGGCLGLLLVLLWVTGVLAGCVGALLIFPNNVWLAVPAAFFWWVLMIALLVGALNLKERR